VSAALRCALWDPAGAKKLSNADFRLFLDGCTEITAETSDPDIRDLIPTLQRLVRNTPEFAPGQAMLALAAWNTATRSLDGQQGSLIATARSALAKAKQLRPDFEDVIAADSMITPASSAQWSHSFPILERGLRLHPDSALLLGLQSQRLMEVGRLGEASQSARQSMTHDPLSARARVNFIDALVYSGRINAAYAELRKFEAIWPNSGALADTRYRLDLRYGDPKSALAQLDRSGVEALTPVALDQSWIAFLQARIDPSPAKIEIALDAFRERYRRDPADIPGYIQALGTFGRADEAFEVTRNSETLDSLEASTDVLFRPHMRSLYADPRFMGLAYRLGLIAYWRETNVWPDFCREPQLPYDCAKEAAKYR
jgi:tetratricopeptide (TPR) repeat protein